MTRVDRREGTAMIASRMNRFLSALSGIVVATAAFGSPAVADFTLASQNTLHLGYGNSTVGAGYETKKYAWLKTEVVAGHDAVLFQEVMNTASLTAFGISTTHATQPPNPAAGNWPHLKGFNGYRESYLGAFKKNKLTVRCYLPLTNAKIAPPNALIRPPDAYLVNTTGKAPTWLLNVHSIWGSSTADRENEAKALAAYVSTVITQKTPKTLGCTGAGLTTKVNRAVLAGDWNLSAAKLQTLFGTAFTVGPSAQTSLTASGALSKSYDHFVWTNSVTVAAAPTVFTPTSANTATLPASGCAATNYRCKFRNGVSDHLSVSITIKE